MRDLLRRVVVEHRTLSLGLTIAMAINVAAYVVVVRPLVARSAGAEDRAATASGALRVAEGELAAAQALVTGRTRAEEELNAFYQKVLPSGLAAARRLTYASLPALARRTNVKYEERRTEIEDVETDARLGHLAIRMVLQCDYPSFRDFLYQLESAPDFVIIDEVALSESEANEPLTLTIKLSTYFRLKANGA